MKQFLTLLKVSTQSMLLSSTNSRGRSRKKAASGLSAVIVIAGLGLYLSGFYSYMLMQALAPSHMEILVFIFMGMAALAGGLLFTTFAVKGVVFGGKDNDLLLSMPVSSTLLMASRVTAIYLENLLFSAFVLLPAGVVCTILSQSGVGHSLLFWARLVIAALTLPLLDTALSVLLGALVAFLSARVSKGALGQNIVMGLFLVVVFYFSFNLNRMISELAANAAGIKDSLTWAAPLLWMGEGIMGDWGLLLAFAVCCILPFALVVFGLGQVYRQAVTAFAARSAQSNYKLSAQSASSQKKALLRKEALRFFGTPMYFWNAGLGLIMLLAAGAASLVMREKLLAFVGMDGFPPSAYGGGCDLLLPVYLSHRCPFRQPGGEVPLDSAGGSHVGQYAAVGQSRVPAAAHPPLYRNCWGVHLHCTGVPAVAGDRASDCRAALRGRPRHVRDADGADLPQSGCSQ